MSRVCIDCDAPLPEGDETICRSCEELCALLTACDGTIKQIAASSPNDDIAQMVAERLSEIDGSARYINADHETRYRIKAARLIGMLQRDNVYVIAIKPV